MRAREVHHDKREQANNNAVKATKRHSTVAPDVIDLATELVLDYGCSYADVASVMKLSATSLARRCQGAKHTERTTTQPPRKGVSVALRRTASKTKHHRHLRYLRYDCSASRSKSKAVMYGGLSGAKSSILASVFAWTDPDATAAVVSASNRAKKEKRPFEAHVLLDATAARAGYAADRAVVALRRCGAKVYLVGGRTANSFMHTKFCVVDGKVVYVGSVNNSVQGQKDNVEVALEDRRVSSAVAFKRRLLKRIARPAVKPITKRDVEAIERRLVMSDKAVGEKM